MTERIHYADAACVLGACSKLLLGEYVRKGVLLRPDHLQTFPREAVDALAREFDERRALAASTLGDADRSRRYR